MIARHILLFVLLIVLPSLYVDYRYFRKGLLKPLWRWLWWLPNLAMLAMTAVVASLPDFIPRNRMWIDLYLLLLGVWVIPVAVFSLCSFLGWGHNLYHKTRQQWGERIGAVLAVTALAAFVYGFTWGFSRVEVKHLDLSFDQLPSSLDGCRIVHVSDLHVGTYAGWRRPVLERAVDSICAQHPDFVFFTGDLQNTRPEEVLAVQDLLRRIPNVYSVLGNHDHGEYIDGSPEEKQAVEKRMVNIQRQLGWRLLVNEAKLAAPSLLVAGTDNDGLPPFPSLADYGRALQDWQDSATFCIMLQHDPSAWRRHILPEKPVPLTLSGHTHGGQVSLFGLRPTQLQYAEDYGLYEQNGCYLHVSGGVGGLVPFRLGLPGEITVITLHSKKNTSPSET